MRGARRLTVSALGALALVGAGVAAAASSTPAPVVVSDPKGDVSGLDLTRAGIERGADGRLRATMTLADSWDGGDLVSSSGVPGSLCLKAWTTTAPPDTTPDYLICVTADKSSDLRGSILQERANRLPARIGDAVVTRPSDRSVTVKFSQTAIGKPATLYVVAEATRPGCTRGSCIDLAPDAPKSMMLKLHKATTTGASTTAPPGTTA